MKKSEDILESIVRLLAQKELPDTERQKSGRPPQPASITF